MEKIILDYIIQNAHFFETIGYYFIFFTSLVESLPVIGFMIPGQTFIMVSGFLAKNKLFSFWLIFLVSTTGAILGDIYAYYLGKKYGESFLKKHGSRFFVKESLIEKTKVLLNEHPGKALFLGRLNSVTRSLAPFLAGVAKVKIGLFSFYVIFGCILWAFLFTSIGFIFGKGFEVVAPIIGKFILISTIIVILFILILNLMKNKGFRLSKYHIHMLTLNFVSLYIFATLSEGIIKGSKIISAFDRKTDLIIQSLRTPTMDNFFISLAHINTPEFIFGIIILSIILVAKKERKHFIPSLLSTLFGYLLVFFTKIMLQRPRPFDQIILESGFSFPSGHATLATIFFLIIIHDFSENIRSDLKRILFVSVNIFMISIFSFSRIYLGVHHTTDVLAGISLGIWVFTFTILASLIAPWFYKRRKVSEILKKVP